MDEVVTLVGLGPTRLFDEIVAAHPTIRFYRFPNASAALAEVSPDTTILAAPGDINTAPLLAKLPRLKWIQALSAGIDGIADVIPPDVVVTNLRGVTKDTVAEQALALLLALRRILPNAPTTPRSQTVGLRPLGGDRHLIVGYGSIGREIGRLSAAFGMDVTGLRLRPDPARPEERSYAELDDWLSWADVVTLACPLTPQTQNLLNRSRIDRLAPHAMIINIARAQVLDQAALLDALADGRLAGAGLDVTDPEPLPADHPLLALPNVVITPHIAGDLPDAGTRAITIFRENLTRYLAGLPLTHPVDRRLGY